MDFFLCLFRLYDVGCYLCRTLRTFKQFSFKLINIFSSLFIWMLNEQVLSQFWWWMMAFLYCNYLLFFLLLFLHFFSISNLKTKSRKTRWENHWDEKERKSIEKCALETWIIILIYWYNTAAFNCKFKMCGLALSITNSVTNDTKFNY